MKKKICFLFILCCVCLICACLVGCSSNESAGEEKDIAIPAQETEEVETPATLDVETYLSMLEKNVKWGLGARDRIDELTIKDGNLYINISLERNDTTMDRFISVTDKVLELKEGYDFWDSVTVDFGSLGYITKTKDDITIDGNESHFVINKEDVVKN